MFINGRLISVDLNAHHIDLHAWAMQGLARPVSVTASASKGVAESCGCVQGTEDTITLMVKWINEVSGHEGTAIYTGPILSKESLREDSS